MTAISIGFIVLASLMGSFPTAYLMGRWLAKGDIREAGSRNVGATNAYQQYGKWAGLLVVLIDAGKGALVIVIGRLLDVPGLAIYIAAVAVTLGHNFNPFLRFRGGKGAATVLGISAIAVWEITAITVVAAVLAIALTRRVVISMVGAFIILNGLTILTGQTLGLVVVCLVLTSLVGGTHVYRQYPQLSLYVRQRRWRDDSVWYATAVVAPSQYQMLARGFRWHPPHSAVGHVAGISRRRQ